MSKKQDLVPQRIDLKTVDIKGNAYVQVHERIRIFRQDQQYKGWSLITTPTQLDNDVAMFKAEILNDKGVVIANGHAREVKESSYINKTSYVENAETSAMGRALGNLGIGVETSFCTADELLVAMAGQVKEHSIQLANTSKGTSPREIQKTEKLSNDQIKKIKELEETLAMPEADLSTMTFENAKKYFVFLTNELKKGSANA